MLLLYIFVVGYCCATAGQLSSSPGQDLEGAVTVMEQKPQSTSSEQSNSLDLVDLESMQKRLYELCINIELMLKKHPSLKEKIPEKDPHLKEEFLQFVHNICNQSDVKYTEVTDGLVFSIGEQCKQYSIIFEQLLNYDECMDFKNAYDLRQAIIQNNTPEIARLTILSNKQELSEQYDKVRSTPLNIPVRPISDNERSQSKIAINTYDSSSHRKRAIQQLRDGS